METAEAIIKDALGEVLVSSAEQAPESFEVSQGIRYLNRMMSGFDAQGIALGYTVVSTPSDAVTVADGAIEGVVFNLAIRLSKSFGMPVSQQLFMDAKNGLDAMRRIGVTIEPCQFGGTLPIGSGNEDELNDYKFYPEIDPTTLTETNGHILLEGET